MKTKNRIIMFIVPYLLPTPGAPWRRIEYFAEYFTKKNFIVYVIGTITFDRSIKKKLSRVKKLSKNLYFRLLNLQFMIPIPKWPFTLFNIIGSIPSVILLFLLKPQIVVASIPHMEYLPLIFLGSKFAGAKLVVDIRDPMEYWIAWIKGISKKFFILIININYALLRRADAVITVTSELARFLARRGVSAYVIRNGADTRLFKPYVREKARQELGLSEDAFIVVMNGYLGGYYDAKPFLRAVELLPADVKKKVLLLVVGGFSDPSYAREFSAYIREKHLKENVKIIDRVLDASMLAKILSAANIGLIPQCGDALLDFAVPAKFYEYIACGLPVLALTRRGSALWNIVNSWRVGYVIEPGDVNSLVCAILDAFNASNSLSRERILKYRGLSDRQHEAEKLLYLIRKLIDE